MSGEIPARMLTAGVYIGPAFDQADRSQFLLFLIAATKFSLRSPNDLIRFRASAGAIVSGEPFCCFGFLSGFFFRRFWSPNQFLLYRASLFLPERPPQAFRVRRRLSRPSRRRSRLRR